MNQKKSYQNYHPSNYFFLNHYQEDASIIREWTLRPEKKDSVKSLGINTNKIVFKTDGSEPLKDLLTDIILCLRFTGTSYGHNNHNEDLHDAIYKSKLPEGIEIYHSSFEKTAEPGKVDVQPETYYDLFSIMGQSSKHNTTHYAGDYIIWQYPDSVEITLKEKDNKLFFGYKS